ncbi:MAG: TraR/DksA C4-type zinc finger protein [bacterium]|nr:TraR/DksA C4-type zinc finger protein [bacterium]
MKNNQSPYSSDLTAKIKTMLEAEKSKLEQELGKIAEKNPHVSGDFDSTYPEYGDKEDENAAEVAEYADRLPLEQGLEKQLRDVIQSLERLKKDNFGICKYCKKPIEEKRLLARPTSSACVSCKKAITQEI